MPRILISAGEVSGDQLAAGLVRALEPIADLEFLGMAGPSMREAGVEAIERSESLSVMGFVEVLGSLPRIRRCLGRMKRALDLDIDLLVVVDAPDFNIPLAKAAAKKGVPVVFLGSPQVWAWRKKRAKVLAGLAAEVICFFPFEPAYFHEHAGEAICIGHPLVGSLAPLPATGGGLALLPGSREQEFKQLLGPMKRVALRWLQRHPGEVVHLALAQGMERPDLGELPVTVHSSIASALEGSQVALSCSGTATLVVACLDRPQVVLYRMNPVSYRVARTLAPDITHIALPNLLTEPFVPEFVQTLDEEAICEALEEAGSGHSQREGMAEVRRAVSGGGFPMAAQRLLHWLNAPQSG